MKHIPSPSYFSLCKWNHKSFFIRNELIGYDWVFLQFPCQCLLPSPCCIYLQLVYASKANQRSSPVCPLGRYGIAAPRFQRPGPWSKGKDLQATLATCKFCTKRSMNEINWYQLALKTSLPFPLNQLNREFQKEGLMPSSMQKSNTGRSASHCRSQWCDLHRTHEWDSEFHLWNRYCVSKWPREGDRIAHYSSNFSHKVIPAERSSSKPIGCITPGKSTQMWSFLYHVVPWKVRARPERFVPRKVHKLPLAPPQTSSKSGGWFAQRRGLPASLPFWDRYVWTHSRAPFKSSKMACSKPLTQSNPPSFAPESLKSTWSSPLSSHFLWSSSLAEVLVMLSSV